MPLSKQFLLAAILFLSITTVRAESATLAKGEADKAQQKQEIAATVTEIRVHLPAVSGAPSMSRELPPESLMNSHNALRSYFGEDNLFKMTRGSKVTFDENGQAEFHKGEILVWASKATVVNTPAGTVTMIPGTIALISGDSNAVSINNLHDSARRSVKLRTAEGLQISLSGGHSLVCASSEAYLKVALHSPEIGRREVRTWSSKDGKAFTRSEISLVTLLHESALLHELSKRPTKVEKVIVDKIIKMAVCLQSATSSHGAFSTTKL